MAAEGPSGSEVPAGGYRSGKGPGWPRLVEPVEPEHLYKGIGLFFLLLILYSYFEEISRVLLIVYASATLAVGLNVLVGLVPRHRKVVSAALGLLIFAGIGAAIWFAVPALTNQLRGLTAEIPRFQQAIEGWSEWLRERTGLRIELLGERTSGFLGSSVEDTEILGRAMGVVEGIFLPLVILIGAIFAVATPNDRLLSALLHTVPRERRDSFRRLFSLLGVRLRGWVKGLLISMLVVGVLTTLGLWLIGVRFALLLGVMAGLFEIVPLIGPWFSGGVAVGVALLDDPTKAMWVAGLMLVIQQVESNLITPIVMSKAAEVHPFVTLFSLFLFGSIFGFLGIVLALPLVLLVWTIVEVLWVERVMHSGGEEIAPLVHE